jgi:hypothetical protein
VLCRALLPHANHIEWEPKFVREVAAALANKCDAWVRQQEVREVAQTLLADEAVVDALEPVFRFPRDCEQKFDWEEIERSGTKVPKAHWRILLDHKDEGCLRWNGSMDTFRRLARTLGDRETPQGVARAVRYWWQNTGHWCHRKMLRREVLSAEGVDVSDDE